MTLMKRFVRLFKADVNAILDNLEEPEQMLKQALRDMEAALINEKKHLKIQNFNLSQLEFKNNSNKQLMLKLETELQLCMNDNNESLSKTLIRRKLILQSSLDLTAQNIDKTIDDKNLLESSIAEMQQTISEITQKVEIVSEKNSHSHIYTLPSSQNKVTNEDVEIEWLRLRSESSKNTKKRKAS